jgi:hypothetical protein
MRMQSGIAIPSWLKGSYKTSADLGCGLVGVMFGSDSHVILLFPANECCDMTAAIKFAKRLLPGVTMISTIAGSVPDTEYRLEGKEWGAFRSR